MSFSITGKSNRVWQKQIDANQPTKKPTRYMMSTETGINGTHTIGIFKVVGVSKGQPYLLYLPS